MKDLITVFLSEFRDRLLEHEAEGRVFEQLVREFRAMGLIKERGRQRTDSIAMLMSVRRLSSLELVVETQLDFIFLPCLQNLIWQPTEEDPRYKHICVENYFHLRPRAFETAFVMSARFKPASFACRRACWMRVSNVLQVSAPPMAWNVYTEKYAAGLA